MITRADIDATQRAFDAAAPVYDATYEHLPGIQRMRAITREVYLEYFPPKSKLLELNCGTGNDAVFLAQHGMTVTATDLSPAMLRETRRKIMERGLQNAIDVRSAAFAQLGGLRGVLFDGAYSNMGGLNCTDDHSSVATALAGLVKPGGLFIATVMPPFYPWEILSFLARLRWRSAFRRFAVGGTRASLHGGIVRTYYHSPRSFTRAFAPHFEPVQTRGLAFLMPPPNAARAYALLGQSRRLLEKIEDATSEWPPFRSMGDHYVIVLRRKED